MASTDAHDRNSLARAWVLICHAEEHERSIGGERSTCLPVTVSWCCTKRNNEAHQPARAVAPLYTYLARDKLVRQEGRQTTKLCCVTHLAWRGLDASSQPAMCSNNDMSTNKKHARKVSSRSMLETYQAARKILQLRLQHGPDAAATGNWSDS
jgi:hypothetical protein